MIRVASGDTLYEYPEATTWRVDHMNGNLFVEQKNTSLVIVKTHAQFASGRWDMVDRK